MNVIIDKKAEQWWESLSDEQKNALAFKYERYSHFGFLWSFEIERIYRKEILNK